MESRTGLQVTIDTLQIVIKFLGRAAVQRQLLVIAVLLIVAWYFSKPLVRGMGKLYGKWLARQRQRISAQGIRSVADDARVRASLQKLRPLIQIADVVTYPLTAILFISLSIPVFQYFGWFTGLLTDALRLMIIFLIYRMLIGLFYVVFDKQRVIYYQARFFRPLFSVIIFLLVVNGITELPTLARAPLFPLFDGLLTLGALFLATIGLFLWIMATYLIVEILQSIITNKTSADPRGVQAWLILLRYGLIALAIIVTFQLVGFSATTLAAVLGGLSIGIGFALQDVLRNFLGGIILLFEGSIRPGDWIQVNNTIGKVENLRIRSTVVRTDDNVEYIVPNQSYLSSTIVAYTYSQSGLILKIPVTVSHDANVRKVQELLVEVAKKSAAVQSDPPPTAALIDFSASSLKFVLRLRILDIQNKIGIETSLRTMILEALEQQNITIVA